MKVMLSVILLAMSILTGQSDSINVTFPNGGDYLFHGMTYSIEWDHNFASSEKVKIDLYKDLAFVDEISITTCSGSYSWTVTENFEPSEFYRIKIQSVNDPSIFDLSDSDFSVFSYLEPPELLSPQEGYSGSESPFEFKWKSVPGADTYTFYIEDINGKYNEIILADTLHTYTIDYGTHKWKVRSEHNSELSNWSEERNIKRTAFELTDIDIVDVGSSSVDWGDFNNDGFLDVIIAGYNGSSYTRLYKNNGNGTFSIVNVPIINISEGVVRWFDYNNDGYLDIFLSGSGYTRIYENNGDETFSNIYATLPNVGLGATVDFADFNNDGLTDIVLTGSMPAGSIDENVSTKIFKNNGNGIFTEVDFYFPGIWSGRAVWGDYNNDGLPDLAVFGSGFGMVFRNNGDETFSDINAGFYLLKYASADWGDYNNDGFLDLLISGESTDNEPITVLYRNNGNGSFSNAAEFPGTAFGSVKWGDFNSDGRQDFVVTGSNDGSKSTRIYMNNGDGTFTDIAADITDISHGEVEWGDYDNDGKLDLIITGYGSGSVKITEVYRNITSEINTPPSSPQNLSSVFHDGFVYLNWDAASDAQTPEDGLYYNVYVGSAPGKSDVLGPESDMITGFRKKPVKGNCDMLNSKFIGNIPSGTYYWGVQSVDNGFMGSEFSAENSFTYEVRQPQIPTALEATGIEYDSFIANWELTGDKGYYIDVATNSSFTKYLSGYESKNVYNSSYVQVSPIQADSAYYYRVRSYNADGVVSGSSNVITAYGPHDPFEEIGFSLSSSGGVYWGDYDNDGWLDLLFANKIYKNNRDETFTLADSGLPETGAGKFGDYNNDGWLDILVNSRDPYFVKIYRNNGDGTFSDSGISFDHRDISKWGDFDNDGLLDILMADSFDKSCFIFKNNGDGTFTEYDTGINLFDIGPNDWGRVEKIEIADYDNNGTLDILTNTVVYYYDDAGTLLRWEYFNNLYDNNGNMTFVENTGHGIYSLGYGALSWGDYNNDGYLDLLHSGPTSSWNETCIYKNNHDGTFTRIYSDFIRFSGGSGNWIDYDNDGLLDFIITGFSRDFVEPDFRRTYIYKNNGDDTFTPIEHNLPNFGYSKIAWGDFNNDLKNDFVISGQVYDYENGIHGENTTVIYKNNNHYLLGNSKPDPPMNLKGVAISSDEDWEIELSWDRATDLETPQAALTYNVFIGTSPTTPDILSASSDLGTGYRRLAASGNSGANNVIKVKGLEPGRYYWSVQTVDHCYTGSEFAMENFIDVNSIENDHNTPNESVLFTNYPNPFNPETSIRFSIPADTYVKLNVYNINGQLVNSLIDSKMKKGYHRVKFNAEKLNSGIYFYELDAEGEKISKKMLLVK